jgi:hypothetical protein
VAKQRIFPIIRNLRIEIFKKVKSGEIEILEDNKTYRKVQEDLRSCQCQSADFEMIYAQFLAQLFIDISANL